MTRLVLLIGTPLVVAAFIGAIYFQIYAGSHATRDGWQLTRDVPAAAALSSSNVTRVKINAQATPFLIYQGDPLREGQRASHAMKAGHLLAPDDLEQDGLALVPVTFSAAPELHRGDLADVYVFSRGTSVLVGRQVVVETPTSIWVPSADEPAWVTLQAGRAHMVAVRASGRTETPAASLRIGEALAALNSSAGGGGVPSETDQPSPSPSEASPAAGPS